MDIHMMWNNFNLYFLGSFRMISKIGKFMTTSIEHEPCLFVLSIAIVTARYFLDLFLFCFLSIMYENIMRKEFGSEECLCGVGWTHAIALYKVQLTM